MHQFTDYRGQPIHLPVLSMPPDVPSCSYDRAPERPAPLVQHQRQLERDKSVRLLLIDPRLSDSFWSFRWAMTLRVEHVYEHQREPIRQMLQRLSCYGERIRAHLSEQARSLVADGWPLEMCSIVCVGTTDDVRGPPSSNVSDRGPE